MARKKSQKINTVPKGVSFMHEPQESYGPLTHTWNCECGGTITMREGGFPTCNDHSIFVCSDCDWISPSPEFQHEPTTRTVVEWGGPTIRTQQGRKQTPEFVKAYRAEYARQMRRLTKERAKFPPSLLKKGKKWVVNPKFTDAMREHMHTFAIDSEKIAEEIVLSGIKRFAPQKKVKS